VIIKQTQRGFDLIEFSDSNGVHCSLQESSVADRDMIWLGCDKANPRQLISGKGWTTIPMPCGEVVMDTRMHLTREQVEELLPHLIEFVESGCMDIPAINHDIEQEAKGD